MADKNIIVDRELSWIKFNKRVLEEAQNERNPLIERLRFISIFQSNYEEFFRVRVGSRIDKLLLDENDSIDVRKELNDIFRATAKLLPKLDEAFDGIMADGAKYFCRVTEETISDAERTYLKQIFIKTIAPVLSPFVIDKSIPFPFIDNGRRVDGFTLKSKNGNIKFGIIPISSRLPKAVCLPGDTLRFILIEDIISMFAYKLFHKYEIVERVTFSIIRNADIDENEGLYDFDIDFRQTMSKLIELRNKLAPVELKYNGEQCPKILAHLKKVLCLPKKQLFRQSTPLSIGFISLIEDKLTKARFPELYYAPRQSVYPAYAENAKSLIDVIRRKDRLLAYPFDDVKFLIDLLSQAAADKRVERIMITLYRVASDSKVVEALIDAARRGKRVSCMVELRARFDEENNIDWSKRLQDAGCEVIYGLPNYKVHCKLLVIKLKDGKDIVQIGTGNFNEKTARLYTDLALFTAKPEIARDAERLFESLEKGVFVESSDHLMVAPLCLKQKLFLLIDEEIEKQKSGRKAEIMLKMNSLTDKELILKLCEASQAGVKITMIIRGICCLTPGVAGKTDNITVISIVGRLLEHSRIYAFGVGNERKYYISSADFMTRNTNQRVETAAPVTDPLAKRRLARILKLSLLDNTQARILGANGSYRRLHPKNGEKELNSQETLYDDALSEKQKSEKN